MTMTIRHAIPEDYDTVVELLREFHTTAGMWYTAFCPESTRLTVEHVATVDQRACKGVVLVAELDGKVVGTLGAMKIPCFVNFGQSHVQEAWWWVTPAARGTGLGLRLLLALHDWARKEGATTLTMISWHGSEEEKIGKLYEEAGFRPMEHHYVKRLK